MNSEFQPFASPPPIPPPTPPHIPVSPPPIPHAPKPRVARWRWGVALAILIVLPLLASVFSARRAGSARDGALLPTSLNGLLLFCFFNMVEFSVVWGLAWAFSRGNKDELFLRWKGWKSIGWGIAYSLLMRFGLMVAMILIFIVLAVVGFDPKTMGEVVKSSGENTQKVFAPIFAGRDPLYKLLVIGLISFVVAGLREELWRAATMAGMLHLAPRKWSDSTKNGVALGLSSALFGLGHGYQGAAGILGTGLLGVALGAIMLRHKSVWPAIVAHGCFDAVSFAALAFATGVK